MALSRGTMLALLGVGLLVAMLAIGAVTAPSRTVAGAPTAATPTPTSVDAPGTATEGTGQTDDPGTATPAAPRTLVGVQGGWVAGGNVRMYSGTDEVWRETRADGYFEVSMLDDGTFLAAFANESSTECGDLASPCARTGYRHVDPDAEGGPEIVSEYGFPVESLTNSEVHAVDRVSENEYVFTDMDEERVVVVENGSIAWEWHASSYYDAPEDPTSRDWLHINDVDVVDGDRFLVSVRNANQIVVLERGEGVVEVINEDRGTSDENCLQGGRLDDFDGEDDGDVRCGDPAVIKEQHNPQWLGPGAVLVADSENDRVVELHRTENGSWEPAWVLREAGGRELDWPRDADRLPNGNTLVTDSLNQRVLEVDPGGELVWAVSTAASDPQIPYEADRLPFGEFAGQYDSGDGTGTPTANATAAPGAGTTLPTANASGAVDVGGSSDVPVLTLAVTGIRGTFGWVPWWFGEVHLAVTILSVGLVIGGGVDRWRNPDREFAVPGRE